VRGLPSDEAQEGQDQAVEGLLMIPRQYWLAAKWGAAALLLGGTFVFGYRTGGSHGRIALAELRAEHAEANQRAVAKAAEQERQQAKTIAAIADKYEVERAEVAERTRAGVLADIRAGRVRVRGACPAAVSETGTASGERDGDPADRGEIAASAIGIGAEADAQLRACQDALRAYTE
jgi:hypothetical protein